jgi:hypothetical protein
VTCQIGRTGGFGYTSNSWTFALASRSLFSSQSSLSLDEGLNPVTVALRSPQPNLAFNMSLIDRSNPQLGELHLFPCEDRLLQLLEVHALLSESGIRIGSLLPELVLRVRVRELDLLLLLARVRIQDLLGVRRAPAPLPEIANVAILLFQSIQHQVLEVTGRVLGPGHHLPLETNADPPSAVDVVGPTGEVGLDCVDGGDELVLERHEEPSRVLGGDNDGIGTELRVEDVLEPGVDGLRGGGGGGGGGELLKSTLGEGGGGGLAPLEAEHRGGDGVQIHLSDESLVYGGSCEDS